MPVYEYEHVKKACKLGKVFEIEMSIKEDALEVCPECEGPVKRLISGSFLSFPKTNTELKGQGFTKLVRKDKGVYENVTANDKESKIVDFSDSSTLPDFKSKISD
jgi:putative FmdB family regulatory protein